MPDCFDAQLKWRLYPMAGKTIFNIASKS